MVPMDLLTIPIDAKGNGSFVSLSITFPDTVIFWAAVAKDRDTRQTKMSFLMNSNEALL
jgi:hypothetical protein